MPATEPGQITLRAGNLRLGAALCARHLQDLGCVALWQRRDRVYLLPLRGGSSGGLPLQTASAAGDRVVHAQDFLRRHGYDALGGPYRLGARWIATRAALLLDPLPRG